MGNFVKVFKLVNWRIFNLKVANELNACVPMMLSIQIAKFKFCQYQKFNESRFAKFNARQRKLCQLWAICTYIQEITLLVSKCFT